MRGLLGNRSALRRGRRCGAFTLPEVLVASAIFALVIGAVIAANLFGWRMWQATDPKLDSDQQCRAMIGQLTTDISCSKSLRVGTGDAAGFTPVPWMTPQQGDALEVRPLSGTNELVRYFRDPATRELVRASIVGGVAETEVMARDIVNATVFRAEDGEGNLLSGVREKMVVAVDLEFGTLGRMAMPMGADRYFKSHDIRLRIATRER